MRAVLLFCIVSAAFATNMILSPSLKPAAFATNMILSPSLKPATWDLIEKNRLQCKQIKQDIVNTINTQRATDDSSEYWALEQRFMDLISLEDKLKKEQVDMIKEVMKPRKQTRSVCD